MALIIMNIETISVQVASESIKGTQYTIVANKNRVTCTCPDYIYRKEGTGASCKHIDVCMSRGIFSINGI